MPIRLRWLVWFWGIRWRLLAWVWLGGAVVLVLGYGWTQGAACRIGVWIVVSLLLERARAKLA